MPSASNLRRHFAAVLSVQSSRLAISVSLKPSAANNTTLARTTSRCARVYCPARRRSSRRSVSLKMIATAAITPGIRRAYGNSSRTYFREPVLDQVESRLDRAMQHSGRIAWHEAPSDPALSILTRSGKISRIRKSSHSTCESLTRSGNPRARLLSTGMATSSRWIPSTLGAWRSRTSIRFASSSRSRGNGTSKCGPASCRRHPSRDTGLTVSN
jgi:hypothetical protein